MRTFHSYGPVDAARHFSVPRTALIARIADQLLADPAAGGHYFTIWAPRQSGKTWLMRQAITAIQRRCGDHIQPLFLSMQGVILPRGAPPEAFLGTVPGQLRAWLDMTVPCPADWQAFRDLFLKGTSPFDRPLALLIDEFDALPQPVIDQLVTLFRDLYHNRPHSLLHGLVLGGVRAVLGVDSDRGSPFNIQRSLHVPNLTQEEVRDLYGQYQAESGQPIDPAVVDRIYEVTRGQPGLVSWFGELFTEKYNQDRTRPLGGADWDRVYHIACHREPNNTVLNLLKKAQGRYRRRVIELFQRADVPFSFDLPWCNYLYTHGVIDFEDMTDVAGQLRSLCRFSSPFIQLRLYNALTAAVDEERTSVPVLEPLDDLSDVFLPTGLDLPALLLRYQAYLVRLRQGGVHPFKGLPRRRDLHLREAIGHFHLYWWLKEAVGRRCAIIPEFPTGNGKVDLLLSGPEGGGVIEVKSYGQRHELPAYKAQAARYARSRKLPVATLALFVPTEDESVLAQLSGQDEIAGVQVTTVCIGWM